MAAPGEIITHAEMCQAEGIGMLQKGMTFRAPPNHGVILMSRRPDAPYADDVAADGSVVYEGHDALRSVELRDPKTVDQPRYFASGRPTENGKFADWTDRTRHSEIPPARFAVYEKLRDGVWTYRGAHLLTSYEYKSDGRRNVFRFTLRPTAEALEEDAPTAVPDEFTRQIPTWVKQEVYKRDRGQCVICGSRDQLHFDHELPFSRGGTSVLPQNIRLLCARHNLSKGSRIE